VRIAVVFIALRFDGFCHGKNTSFIEAIQQTSRWRHATICAFPIWPCLNRIRFPRETIPSRRKTRMHRHNIGWAIPAPQPQPHRILQFSSAPRRSLS